MSDPQESTGEPGPVRPAPPAAPAPAGAAVRRSRPHIVAFDGIRLIIMVFVVGVHTLSFAGGHVTMTMGAVTTIFHTSRELFLLLTALVLSYNYGHRELKPVKFWKRRFWLVLPAYIAWSAIYYAANGHTRGAFPDAFIHDLEFAGARYHMYFLLVSMQIYLLFPLIRWVLKKTEGYHWWLFAAACVYQLVLTIGLHYHVGRHGTSLWAQFLNTAGQGYYVQTYLLYVIGGAIAGWHFDELCAFTRRHIGTIPRIVAVAATGVAAGIAVYLVEIEVYGATPGNASAVFQPVVIFESLAFGMALLAAGLLWSDRGARGRKFAAAGSASSFGIYLAHPLVLQVLLLIIGSSYFGPDGGLLGAMHRLHHSSFEVLILLLIVVPFIYAVSWVIASAVRRTPFSLMLTGREYQGSRSKHRQASLFTRLSNRFKPSPRVVAIIASIAVVASVGAFAGHKIVSAIDRPWNTSVSKLQVGDMTRSYTTLTPKTGLAADAPIILVLSGIYAGQNQEINRDQFTSYMKVGKAELVYPLAYRESWNAVGCCSWASNAAVNDLGFIEALVPKVDPGHKRPIYVMGYSNGGRLAYRIACTNPTLFDGYAIVKADPIPGCEVLDEMKIMQVASLDDNRVPYLPSEKGQESPAATVQVARLRKTDGCSTKTVTEKSGNLTYTVWPDCKKGTRVGFAVYTTGKHLYPRPPNSKPAASQVIWAFFTNTKLAAQPKS